MRMGRGGGVGGDGAIQTKKEKKCNAVQLLVKQTTWRAAHGKRQRTKTGSDLLAKLSFNKGSTVSAGEGGRETEMLHKRIRETAR